MTGNCAFLVSRGGRVDVEEEAVFAAALHVVLEDHVGEDGVLRAVGAELGCVALTLPFGCGFRRLPAQVAHRRRGVGKAEPGADLAVVDGLAVDLAVDGLDGERVGGGGYGESQQSRRGQTRMRPWKQKMSWKSSE